MPGLTQSPNWYYSFQGQQNGPVPLGIIQQRIISDQLSYNDMVWRDGLPQWAPAGTVPELSHLFTRMPPVQADDLGQNAGMRMLLPVGRSGWAIAAGYLGLFSFLACPAPLSLIVSAIAIWDIRRDKNKHGMGRAIFGLVMGILGSIALLIGTIAILSK